MKHSVTSLVRSREALCLYGLTFGDYDHVGVVHANGAASTRARDYPNAANREPQYFREEQVHIYWKTRAWRNLLAAYISRVAPKALNIAARAVLYLELSSICER